MRVFFLFVLFNCFYCYSDGPWSAGLLPGESYRYNPEAGFSKWTNYIYNLNLRAEATDYSNQTDDPKKYIVFPENLTDTQLVVVGESDFVAQKEFVVFTNLVGVSTNNGQEYKTLSIRVNALGAFDDFLLSLLTNYIDNEPIEEAGGLNNWLNETDLEWQWTLVRPELCYCNNPIDDEPVGGVTENECYSEVGGEWICPEEAYAWRQIPVKRYSPPTLSISSAWERLELPIKTNVTISYNFTKTYFGWEVDRLDDFYWSETYDEYRITNKTYGFSVDYAPKTITQSITRVNYSVVERFADNYSVSQNVVGNRKEVVVNAEKEFILEPKLVVVESVLDSLANRNKSDLSRATSVLSHKYSFTNETYSMFVSDVEISGQYASDEYNVMSNGIEIVSGMTLYGDSENTADLEHGYLIVDEVFVPGGAVFLPSVTVTNYFSVNEVVDIDAVVQSVFNTIPEWGEGVAYTEIITTIKDSYVIVPSFGRKLRTPYSEGSYFTVSELSSTNYLDEREKVLGIMNATWGAANGPAYPVTGTVSRTLHASTVIEPEDGTWHGFWDIKSRSFWNIDDYKATWEDGDACDYWYSKTVRSYSENRYDRNNRLTYSTSYTDNYFSPKCASNGSPNVSGYYEAPWDLYWDQNTPVYSYGRALGLVWTAHGFGHKTKKTENSSFSSMSYNPSRITRSYQSGSESLIQNPAFVHSIQELVWPVNMSIAITNLSTNLSARVYQYAIFDNRLDAPYTIEIVDNYYEDTPVYSEDNNCRLAVNSKAYTTRVDIAESPLASAPTNWLQYVPSVQMPVGSGSVQFDNSRYGVSEYPNSSWIKYVSGPSVTCADGYGDTSDTAESWRRETVNGSLEYAVFGHANGTRSLNTMLFIMDWDFPD